MSVMWIRTKKVTTSNHSEVSSNSRWVVHARIQYYSKYVPVRVNTNNSVAKREQTEISFIILNSVAGKVESTTLFQLSPIPWLNIFNTETDCTERHY